MRLVPVDELDRPGLVAELRRHAGYIRAMLEGYRRPEFRALLEHWAELYDRAADELEARL